MRAPPSGRAGPDRLAHRDATMEYDLEVEVGDAGMAQTFMRGSHDPGLYRTSVRRRDTLEDRTTVTVEPGRRRDAKTASHSSTPGSKSEAGKVF